MTDVDPATSRRRIGVNEVAGILSLLAAVLAVGYAVRLPTPAIVRPAGDDVRERLSTLPAAPYVLFSTTQGGEDFGRLAAVSVGDARGRRFVADLECQRVHFAADRGLCLSMEYAGAMTIYRARVFDGGFRTIATLPLTGLPSRTRVSADGRYGAITVFERGHSYADAGFSTRTTVVDMQSSVSLGDLEQFVVIRDNAPFKAVDFNFWGVTFMRDSNRFYATLATAGRPYLVEGRIDSRTLRVIREGIECPSLSPDNRRLAYKRLVGAATWRIHVLDLTTTKDIALARETRSVDDQVEWVNDNHLMYQARGEGGSSVWRIAADGMTPPEPFIPRAYSPALVR